MVDWTEERVVVTADWRPGGKCEATPERGQSRVLVQRAHGGAGGAAVGVDRRRCVCFCERWVGAVLERMVRFCVADAAMDECGVEVDGGWMVVLAGEIMECRARNALESPYLVCVRPLAVVAGEENRVIASGFNLTGAATRYAAPCVQLVDTVADMRGDWKVHERGLGGGMGEVFYWVS